MTLRPWGYTLALAALVGAAFDIHVPLPSRDYRYLLVFDITQSMNTVDVAPAGSAATGPRPRLAAAKAAAKVALAALPCDASVGVALFSGHRTLLLFEPVAACDHAEELQVVIDNVDWRAGWVAKSEVSKGLFAAIALAADLAPEPKLVWFSDGHEAPPLHPRLRPRFRGTPGSPQSPLGVIVGVGGDDLTPIPKLDGDDRPVGHWGADEVMQIDPYRFGRAGTSRRETMVGAEDGLEDAVGGGIPRGMEHLSSLREGHLRSLAAATGLDYQRLTHGDALARYLTGATLAIPVVKPVPVALPLAALALALWLGVGLASRARGLAFWRGRRKAGQRPSRGNS